MNQYFRRQEEARVQRASHVNLLSLVVMMAMASACGTASNGNIIKTVHGIESAAPFSNVLVVSVAGDHPSRAQFEQEVVAAISGDDTLATPYYAVVGRNPQLTRSVLNNVVRARVFDAVLLARLQGQDQPDLVPNRPTGRQFDLYLYDYKELNIPASIEINSTVSFVAEIYDTRAEKKVWAIESLIFESESVASAISEQAAVIASEMLKDGLVRR